MSVLSVARRDFLDVRRAKLVWAPVGLYTLFMLLFYYGQTETQNPDFDRLLLSLAGIGGALLIPLIALVAAYLAIAGERESGSIKFTVGPPVSRSDVVLGKFGARGAIVGVGLLVSFVIGIAVAALFVPDMEFQYGDYFMFVGLTLLYAVAYVAVAIGISASTKSRSRAMAGGIGFFFVFNLVWNFLPFGPTAILRFIFDKLGIEYSQEFFDFIYSLSPTGAYLNGLQLVIPDDLLNSASGGSDVSSYPFYLEGWFMLLILAAWVVVPLAVGLWRFERAQLG